MGNTCNRACRNRLLIDPERDLRQHHDHDERDVCLYEVIAQLPLQVEMDHLHRVVTCKINSACEESGPQGQSGLAQKGCPCAPLNSCWEMCIFIAAVWAGVARKLYDSV